MKKLLTLLTTLSLITVIEAQTVIINKQIKEFPDIYDLSTPLNAGVTFTYFMINGTNSLWRDATTILRPPSPIIPDGEVGIEKKEQLLNSTVKEVIIYNDSVACMISFNGRYYNTRGLVFENGKWLNYGEDVLRTIEESREKFHSLAPKLLSQLRMVNKVKTVSTDTLSFVNYIKQQGAEPKVFMLEKLAKFPLVIYGEIHRRKVSWDFLSNVLNDKVFPEIVGTVFMEMPSYQQPEFDRFYALDELKTDILLEIFRSPQPQGWCDRGMYEFLLNIWKLNKTLPAEKKIKVIATDEQAPWKTLQTNEDFKKWQEKSTNRDTRMADIIEQTVKTKTDKRNCLFIVGFGHAYKSSVPGNYSSERGESALSAGAQLVKRLSEENIFIIFQHVPMMTNFGSVGLVREGLFDAVFEITGNKPVAFNLANSPFGAEHFDADYDMSFDKRTGNFANNFDGYIFLQPLKDEDTDYVLYDIYTEQFIEDVKQRLKILGWGNINRMFGVDGEVTPKKIIDDLKKYEGSKRFSDLFE